MLGDEGLLPSPLFAPVVEANDHLLLAEKDNRAGAVCAKVHHTLADEEEHDGEREVERAEELGKGKLES